MHVFADDYICEECNGLNGSFFFSIISIYQAHNGLRLLWTPGLLFLRHRKQGVHNKRSQSCRSQQFDWPASIRATESWPPPSIWFH